MVSRITRRALAGLCVSIVGCTSLAALDDLELGAPARIDGGEPASDGEEPPAVALAPPAEQRWPDAASGPDLDAGRQAGDEEDAAADALTPKCWLQNECTCKDKSDCPGSAFECCNGRCTDTATDTLHCGTCGNPCPSNQTCDRAQCACPGLFPDQACVPGVCIDFMSDKEHCGRCMHSCLGGQCWGQACQAVPMATHQQEPMGIAVDAEYVYFANKAGNTVGRVPKNATVPCAGSGCVLYANPLLDEPVSVATQEGDTRVYVSNHAAGGPGKVLGIAKGPWSGSADVLATGQGLWGIAMHAGTVYISALQDPRSPVGRILADGGVDSPVRGRSFYDVTAIALVGDWVFFGARLSADAGPPIAGLFKVPLDTTCVASGGCMPGLVFVGARPRAITSNSGYVFWTSDDDKVRRVARSCTGSPCPVTVIADSQNDAQAIVADEATAYWANAEGGGTIRKGSVFTTCKGIACQAITPPLGKVYGLAQDDKALYFTTRSSGPPGTGIVWRIAK